MSTPPSPQHQSSSFLCLMPSPPPSSQRAPLSQAWSELQWGIPQDVLLGSPSPASYLWVLAAPWASGHIRAVLDRLLEAGLEFSCARKAEVDAGECQGIRLGIGISLVFFVLWC